MAKLHLLGTGSGLVNPSRYASAYLLETQEGDILFDAGEPVAATLVRRGYDLRRLNGIIISHTHPDHLGGFPMLIQQIHLSRRHNPLCVYAPLHYIERIFEHLSLHYLYPAYFSFPFVPHALGEKIEVCGIDVHPILTTHLEYLKEKVSDWSLLKAFAFKVKVGEISFLYSGDLGSFDDIKSHLDDCNYALIETTHAALDTVVDWAMKHPRTKILITHISADFDMDEFTALTEKTGTSNITLAEEGSTINMV